MNIDLKLMRPKGFHSEIQKNLEKCIRRVDLGSGWKKVKKCPICKSKKRKIYLIKYKIKIFECSRCSSAYTEKIPKLFDDVYENKQQFNHHQSSYEKNRLYRIKRFGSERIKLLQKYKKKGSLLDIGCGNGWFLEAAKKFYEVEGMEKNKSLVNFTRNKLKINVYNNVKEINKKYDIITLFDVIEHVASPPDFVTLLHKLLNKNGIILFYTPNKDSIGFRYMKDKSNLVIPPYHITYLNRKSFNYISKKFTVVYSATFGLDVADIYSYLRDEKKRKNLLKKYSFKDMHLIQSFLDKIHMSNHLRVIYKKK